MKDEIKEIAQFDATLEKSLEDFMEAYKIVDEDKVYSNGTEYVPIFRVKQWLDYNNITNLQEKYERMKENAEILSNGYNELEKRIDKAIEFLDNEYNYKKGDAKFNRTDYVIWQSLKNILNGGDE